jgi:pyrroloquinoline quinone biosynthesis protein B
LIRLRILGAAAGGGLPQWNCSCANCLAARRGEIPSQTQSSIAITADDEHWFLINASPDLTRQIESTPELQPKLDSRRNSPVTGVLLTNADIDHVLGLLLLRQRAQPLAVYSVEQTRKVLQWVVDALAQFGGLDWRTFAPGKLDCFKQSSLRAIDLGNSVAFEFRDHRSERAIVIAPAVGAMTDELRDAINRADIVLFDGTFWSDDELRAFRADARSAREMNHLPISGGSLELLRGTLPARKIYIHINNTNPIWMPNSPERQQLERARIEVGYDGLELTV